MRTAPSHPQPPSEPVSQQLELLLNWLQRLLAWHIDVTRATFGALADDPYRGLYLPDAEAALLAQPLTLDPLLLRARAALHAERLALAAQAPPDAPLSRLARRCDLDLFAQDILLLALAPELDGRFERLYAFVQDDVTRRRPSIELALRMLCVEPQERMARRAALTAAAPLLRWHLVQVVDDPARPSALLTRTLLLDERIVGELLGQAQVDPLLRAWVVALGPLAAPQLDAGWLTQLSAFVGGEAQRLVLALVGQPGSGRRGIAAMLAGQLGRSLLSVRLAGLLPVDADASGLLEQLERECLLRDAVLLIDDAGEILTQPEVEPRKAALLAMLDRQPGLVVLALEQPWEPRNALGSQEYVVQMLPDLSFTQREAVWLDALGAAAPARAMLARLSSTFRLNSGQIVAAAALAGTLARWRDPQAGIEAGDLYAASRAQSSGKLDALAQKLRPTYSWNNLVLPDSHLRQLREICVQVRQRRTVLERWGFDAHLAMGKGVNVLFAGPSGTGKTMAAEVIAAELGLELYRIDLAGADPAPGSPEDQFSVTVKGPDDSEEVFASVSFERKRGSRNVVDVINKESKLIKLAEIESEAPLAERRPAVGTYNLPAPERRSETTLSTSTFEGDLTSRIGLQGLEAVEEITMVCVPDVMAGYMAGQLSREDVKAVQLAVIAHCEKMKDRFAILDCLPDLNAQQVNDWRMNEAGYDSKFAAVYYPWVWVANPLAEQGGSSSIKIPPSGYIAGMYARVDGERGVHKAPANEILRGVLKLELNVSKGEQDILNPNGINCIRSFPGRGIRVWGARTLSSDASWRYINVRRLFSNIEESVYDGTQWVVFEPNDRDLWARVKRTISAYLTNVWRSGALFGSTADEAFYVKCDDELNPPEVRDAGMLVVEVGISPVKPAEFVIFRFSQTNGTEEHLWGCMPLNSGG